MPFPRGVPSAPSPTAASTGSPVNGRGENVVFQSLGVFGAVGLPLSIVTWIATGAPATPEAFSTRATRYWVASA